MYKKYHNPRYPHPMDISLGRPKKESLEDIAKKELEEERRQREKEREREEIDKIKDRLRKEDG